MPTLNWIGKDAVVNHHREVPYHLLRCDEKLSVGDPGSGNLLVQGDNLLALKALLPYYAGKVKCIYIDPPYNTGNENWVYNDNVNSPEIRKWLGQVVGKEAEDLSRHDKWLCMMYPRLALLHEMLREDGVIMISIDDVELENLLLLVGEIFGRGNILSALVWEKGKKGDSKFFSVNHEYIVVAARSKDRLVSLGTRWRKRKEGIEEALQQYEDLRQEHDADHGAIRKAMMAWYRGLQKADPAKAHKHYSWSDNRGLYFPDNFHGPDDGRKSRPRYDIIHPVTGKPCKKPRTGWRWEEDRTKAALAESPPRIHFGPNETTIPCRKSYLTDMNEEPFQSVFYKDGRAATKELDRIVGQGRFPFPKDSEILAELIGLVTESDDIVLDSFAGSGTTGHAVLKLNHRRKQNLRFVLVELDPEIAEPLTRQRLQKAISGYVPISKKKDVTAVPGLGGGVRFCRLSHPIFDEVGQIHAGVRFADLAAHVYFTETGEPIPKRPSGKQPSPLLGVCNGTAMYLLFNGVLGDKRPDGGNVLTSNVLEDLPAHDGPKVVYGEGCRLGAARLKRAGITFKQVPYEIKVS